MYLVVARESIAGAALAFGVELYKLFCHLPYFFFHPRFCLVPVGTAELGKFYAFAVASRTYIFGNKVYLFARNIEHVRSRILYFYVVAARSVVIFYVFYPDITSYAVRFVDDKISHGKVGVREELLFGALFYARIAA